MRKTNLQETDLRLTSQAFRLPSDVSGVREAHLSLGLWPSRQENQSKKGPAKKPRLVIEFLPELFSVSETTFPHPFSGFRIIRGWL